MLFSDDPAFLAFCKAYGAHEAFLGHLAEQGNKEVYSRATQLAKVYLGRGEKKRAILLLWEVGRIIMAGAENERQGVLDFLRSLMEAGDINHVCGESPTGFGKPVSEIITNCCMYCGAISDAFSVKNE